MCEFEINGQQQFFSLSGLCSSGQHDRKYTLEADQLSKPYFKGISTSIIKWVRADAIILGSGG